MAGVAKHLDFIQMSFVFTCTARDRKAPKEETRSIQVEMRRETETVELYVGSDNDCSALDFCYILGSILEHLAALIVLFGGILGASWGSLGGFAGGCRTNAFLPPF